MVRQSHQLAVVHSVLRKGNNFMFNVATRIEPMYLNRYIKATVRMPVSSKWYQNLWLSYDFYYSFNDEGDHKLHVQSVPEAMLRFPTKHPERLDWLAKFLLKLQAGRAARALRNAAAEPARDILESRTGKELIQGIEEFVQKKLSFGILKFAKALLIMVVVVGAIAETTSHQVWKSFFEAGSRGKLIFGKHLFQMVGSDNAATLITRWLQEYQHLLQPFLMIVLCLLGMGAALTFVLQPKRRFSAWHQVWLPVWKAWCLFQLLPVTLAWWIVPSFADTMVYIAIRYLWLIALEWLLKWFMIPKARFATKAVLNDLSTIVKS